MIVALANTVVFCEVKTRRSEAFGLPAEAVGWKKQRKIRTAASIWMQRSGVHPAVTRFDVASVVQREVTVIEAAY